MQSTIRQRRHLEYNSLLRMLTRGTARIHMPPPLLCASRAAVDQHLHSSESAAVGLLLWALAGTDRRIDIVPVHRLCSTFYAGSASK